MCVCRINKTKNYTVMSNYHLQDKRLSFKAKGLLSFMLSLPEDWDYTIRGLAHFSSDGVWCVKNTLNELKKFGYLSVTKINPQVGSGRFEYVYDIFEQSQNEFAQPEKKSKTKKAKSRKPSSQANKTRGGFSTLEKTSLVNSTIEKTSLENRTQQNTERPTTKKQLITEKEITEKKESKEREKEKEKNSLSSDINSLGQILDLDIKKEASAINTDQTLQPNSKTYSDVIVAELNSKVKSVSGSDKIFFEPDKDIEELIQKHLENGFTTQDFFDVINLKVKTWLGTKMAVQLKPSVIFSEKNFKNYVAEVKLLDLTNPEYNLLVQGKQNQVVNSDYDLEERTKYFEELENRAQVEA